MKYALALTCLMFVAGCGVHPPIQGREDPYAAGQIHFNKDDLRTQTAVGRPVVSRDDSGILHVMVPIRSAINKRLYVDYRVTFFDKNGQPLNDQMGWMTKTLEMNTPDQITVNSMTPRAADFQVDFRWAR